MSAKIRGISELCKMFNKNIFIAICFKLKQVDIQKYTHSKMLFVFSIPLSKFSSFFVEIS